MKLSHKTIIDNQAAWTTVNIQSITNDVPSLAEMEQASDSIYHNYGSLRFSANFKALRVTVITQCIKQRPYTVYEAEVKMCSFLVFWKL
jgi:hypothetical protein